MRRLIGGTAALLAALAAFSGPRDANASGFAIRENSAEALGTAFAGNGSSATFLSTIFNNPAGMTEFTGDRAQVDGSLIVPSYKFSGSGTSSCAGVGGFPAFCPPGGAIIPFAGDNGGDAGNAAFIPAGYILHSITPDLKFGFALTVPFGLQTKYTNTWVGRYLGIKSLVQSLDLNPNLAYRVNNWLSVGAGISANYLYGEFTRAIDFNAATGNPPGSIPDGQFRFNGADWSWGYDAGVFLKPTDQTNVGISYRSRILHTLQGNANFTNVPCTMALPLCFSPLLQNSQAKSSLNLPGSLDFSITQKITPEFRISADVQWTNWSQVQSLAVTRVSGSVISVVPEHFRDTVFASVGATYIWNDTWTFRGGVAFDESPVTDQFRTVSLPDANRFWVALGVGYKITEGVSVDLGYAHIFIPGSITMNSSVNNTTPPSGPFGNTDTIHGSYTASVDLVSLQTRFRF